MELELLNKRGMATKFKLPEGWQQKVAGTCHRGDRYWDYGRETWITVRDSHTFLGVAVKNLQCVIEQVVEEC